MQGADILFDQTLTVELGGLTCQLIHLGGEHSEDSTAVYCPQEGVLFLGDGLCQEMFHGEWSYDLADYRARIDKIKDLPCRFYVNSHWDVQDADEFTAYYRRLIALGELAGESTDPADVLGRYRRAHGCDPDEETEGDLLSFVHGNRKRQAAKKPSSNKEKGAPNGAPFLFSSVPQSKWPGNRCCQAIFLVEHRRIELLDLHTASVARSQLR